MADNKFTWVIKNFSTLQAKTIFSNSFIIGNCKWRLVVYPKGFNKPDTFSVFMEVANHKTMPAGWKRHAKYILTIVNQNSEIDSKRNEGETWFDHKTPGWGLSTMNPLGEFLVNDELKIVAEIIVYEVIGGSDVTMESEEPTQPLKRIKLDVDDVGMELSNGLVNEALLVREETIDVNGFRVLPSQVVFVRRIFEKHPDIALHFRPKNIHLKTAYMNFLLNIIETLCQSPWDLSDDDLKEADIALASVKGTGFKVDWLEQKMEEVKEKKKVEEARKIYIQELEKELKEFKQICLEMEARLEKEKAKVSDAGAPLTLDDVV